MVSPGWCITELTETSLLLRETLGKNTTAKTAKMRFFFTNDTRVAQAMSSGAWRKVGPSERKGVGIKRQGQGPVRETTALPVMRIEEDRPMSDIRIMVDHAADGLWCDDETREQVPSELRERLAEWNWYWELCQYQLCEDPRQPGHHFWEQDPGFDHDECAFIGLLLAFRVKASLPDHRVFFINEAELDAKIEAEAPNGPGASPQIVWRYEILASPDICEARPDGEIAKAVGRFFTGR